jgi:hypothetical protein
MFAYTPFNQDISGWQTSSGESFTGMFESTVLFNQNVSTAEIHVLRFTMAVFVQFSAIFSY